MRQRCGGAQAALQDGDPRAGIFCGIWTSAGRNFNLGEAFDAHFNFCNRGKKSICVALGEPGEHGPCCAPPPWLC